MYVQLSYIILSAVTMSQLLMVDVCCYGHGAGSEACVSMIPGHQVAPQSSSPPFSLAVSMAHDGLLNGKYLAFSLGLINGKYFVLNIGPAKLY